MSCEHKTLTSTVEEGHFCNFCGTPANAIVEEFRDRLAAAERERDTDGSEGESVHMVCDALEALARIAAMGKELR